MVFLNKQAGAKELLRVSQSALLGYMPVGYIQPWQYYSIINSVTIASRLVFRL